MSISSETLHIPGLMSRNAVSVIARRIPNVACLLLVSYRNPATRHAARRSTIPAVRESLSRFWGCLDYVFRLRKLIGTTNTTISSRPTLPIYVDPDPGTVIICLALPASFVVLRFVIELDLAV